MLKEYLNKNNISKESFSEEIGVEVGTLKHILYNPKYNNMSLQTAYRIQAITGLYPWQYLKGLEELELIHKRYKAKRKKLYTAKEKRLILEHFDSIE